MTIVFIALVFGLLEGAAAGSSDPPARRKLVPATHSAFQLEGRWLFESDRTSPNYYPILDRSDAIGLAGLSRLGAHGHQTVMPFRLAFRGTKSVSLHFDNKYRLFPVLWRILPDRSTWKVAGIRAHSLLEDDLDPNQTYELQVVHSRLFTSPRGFRLLGVGLDIADSAKAVSLPRKNKTLEFIGDSISTVIHVSPSTLASIPLVACQILGASCTIVAQAGATLLSNDPAVQPGMLSAYFRRWIPSSNDPTLQAPKWDFRKSSIPDSVVINLGTNDRRFVRNNATLQSLFVSSYVHFIRGIRREYGTKPTIYVQLPFGGRYAIDGTWTESLPIDLFTRVVKACEDPRVKLLNTTGWLDSNDVGDLLRDRIHPNVMGNLFLGKKVAGALMAKKKQA